MTNVLEARQNPHKLIDPTLLSQDAKLAVKASQKLSKQRSKKRKSFSLSLKRRKVDSLKLPATFNDPQLVKQITDSFAWAFFTKQMRYASNLVYDHPKVPQSMNKPAELEPRLQKLDKESEAVLLQFRARETQGVLPPVIMHHDPIQGFYVAAARDLPELTLIAEYLGQVRTDMQTRLDVNDSIMELLCTGNPNSSLVVVPYEHANVARFFNGINNSVKDSKRTQQNVRTMRCQVNGQATVLLFTKRLVKKGEILMFDYNEAGKDLYPTDHFV